eukprot:m.390324 g.390324  ORF g.390324 m.390324 type:complete len:54 (+) comp196791_c0_seq1:53-214(+)
MSFIKWYLAASAGAPNYTVVWCIDAPSVLFTVLDVSVSVTGQQFVSCTLELFY